MTEPASKALWVKCGTCGHRWVAAYYPLPLGQFASILKKHANCPKCDGPGFLAEQTDGELAP